MRRLAIAMWLLGAVSYALHSPNGSNNPAQEEMANHVSLKGESIDGLKRSASTLSKSRSTRSADAGLSTAVRADHPRDENPVQHVKVSRPVAAQSEPSFSSPTTYRYPQDRALQALRRQGPWVEVLDPVTKFKGWVLHHDLSSPDLTIAHEVAKPVPEPLKEKNPAAAIGISTADVVSVRPRATQRSKEARMKEKAHRAKGATRSDRRRGRDLVDPYNPPPIYASRRYGRGYAVRRSPGSAYLHEVSPKRRHILPPLASRRYRVMY